MDSLSKKTFYTVEEVLKDVQNGKLIIIVDDSSADNEGVIFQAAQKVIFQVNTLAKIYNYSKI